MERHHHDLVRDTAMKDTWCGW